MGPLEFAGWLIICIWSGMWDGVSWSWKTVCCLCVWSWKNVLRFLMWESYHQIWVLLRPPPTIYEMKASVKQFLVFDVAFAALPLAAVGIDHFFNQSKTGNQAEIVRNSLRLSLQCATLSLFFLFLFGLSLAQKPLVHLRTPCTTKQNFAYRYFTMMVMLGGLLFLVGIGTWLYAEIVNWSGWIAFGFLLASGLVTLAITSAETPPLPVNSANSSAPIPPVPIMPTSAAI